LRRSPRTYRITTLTYHQEMRMKKINLECTNWIPLQWLLIVKKS